MAKVKKCVTLKRGSNPAPVKDTIEPGLKNDVIFTLVDGKMKKMYISKT